MITNCVANKQRFGEDFKIGDYTYSHNCGMTKEPANPKACPQDKIRRAVKGIRK